MEQMKAHPNTEAVIDAWRRLSTGLPAASEPMTDDYPGVIGRLFVINLVGRADYCFRRAGHGLESMFGRQLVEHNFLTLWAENDRGLVAACLETARMDRGPVLIRARGQTLDGAQVELEFALAPLVGAIGAPIRFLGLCQTTSPDAVLLSRPLHRLQAVAVFPPAPHLAAAIRIVGQS
jgi:hypothetical protein